MKTAIKKLLNQASMQKEFECIKRLGGKIVITEEIMKDTLKIF